MEIAKLLLVMLFSIAVVACGGGSGGSTAPISSGIDLTGATANGAALGGRLIAPVTVGNHTYYYWDASGDGTSAGADTVTHDQLDQIFNGGTLGDSTKDTSDTTVNVITLSNAVRIHLPTTAELSSLFALTGWTHTGWSGSMYWSASQASSPASPGNPDFHNIIMDSKGSFLNYGDAQPVNVVFEVLDAASPISATATTTAQNLTVGRAMTSFTPLIANGGTIPYTYSYIGTLPPGLSFNASTGAVTGTPSAPYATANVVFSVNDASANVASTTSTVSFTVTVGGGGGSGSSSSPFAGNWSGNWSIVHISGGNTCSWAGTWAGTVNAQGIFLVRSTPVWYTGNPSSCGSETFGAGGPVDSSGAFSFLMGCNGGIGGTGPSGNGFPFSGTFNTSPRSVSGSVYCSGVYLGVSYQITEAFSGN